MIEIGSYGSEVRLFGPCNIDVRAVQIIAKECIIILSETMKYNIQNKKEITQIRKSKSVLVAVLMRHCSDRSSKVTNDS